MFSITYSLPRLLRAIPRWYLLAFVGVLCLYLLTRLVNILGLPLFCDEGIYLNWARIAAGDSAWRFISLLDGKQPLQTWGTIPFVKLMPNNLPLAGRLFSVTTGFFGMIGMMSLAGYLWGRRASLMAALLYICTPYFLLYDRMALVDSAVCAATIWILFGSLLLWDHKRIDIAIIFGVVAGVGLLAKSSILMFIALSGLAPIMTIRKKLSLSWIWASIDYLFLLGITVMVSIACYLTQKLFSPWFGNIAAKNLTFILSLSEWRSDPLQLVRNNIIEIPRAVLWETGWITGMLGIIGLVILLWRTPGLGRYLLLWVLLPFVFVVTFNKVTFPRYFIFFGALLTLLATYMLNELYISSNRKPLLLRLAPIAVTLSVLLIQCFPYWTDVTRISLPPVDRGQYIIGATAVWGVDRAVEIIRRDSLHSSKKPYIAAEGDFGLVADVVQAYLRPTDAIELKGYWPLDETHIRSLSISHASVRPTYVIIAQRSDIPIHWTGELMDEVASYPKPSGDAPPLRLYKIRPPQANPL